MWSKEKNPILLSNHNIGIKNNLIASKNISHLWCTNIIFAHFTMYINKTLKGSIKRHFIIDQQIARHLGNTVNVFQTPLPFYATVFLIQRFQPIMIKGRDYSLS